MNQSRDFFAGPIADDYREVLESAPLLAAVKATSTGKKCSMPKICKSTTQAKNCSDPDICKMTSQGKNCSGPKICKGKKAADLAGIVPGWSHPPAPPLA